MNTQVTGVSALSAVIVVAVVVGVIFGIPRIDQMIKSKAITECGQVAASADKVNGFNGAVYKACLEDKGYTSSIQ